MKVFGNNDGRVKRIKQREHDKKKTMGWVRKRTGADHYAHQQPIIKCREDIKK